MWAACDLDEVTRCWPTRSDQASRYHCQLVWQGCEFQSRRYYALERELKRKLELVIVRVYNKTSVAVA